MESVTVADLPHAVGGKVSLVGAEIKEIPAELSKHYGSTAVELTISHCQLRCAERSAPELAPLGPGLAPTPAQSGLDAHSVSMVPALTCVRRINHLEGFSCLKTLVLDNNEIGDDWAFPLLPTLETLWINHNNVSTMLKFYCR